MSKKIFRFSLPWLLMLFGFFSLNYFNGIPGGVMMILGLIILIDRLLPQQETN